ncbi:MAG: domain S-box [Gemmatimonadetes bacterium]|jgi:PAS domain S-box-containing protein|nr:domain S-box [Gemmatimonadota bacterium]
MNTHSLATPSSVDVIAADALRMIRERGAQVLNAIDDGVFFLDGAGLTIFVNDAAVRMLGFTNREIMGRSMHELTHHHYADGSAFPNEECPILSSVTDAVQQRVGGDTFWTKAGAALPVDYTSIPIKDGRTVIGVVVTFRDISDQQRLEEQDVRLRRERETRDALRESEARYRFLAEAIPVQIWTARPDGSLDYVTRRVADYFGLTSEQILADGWQNIVHPHDLPATVERWTRSLATGEPYEVEFRLRGSDGVYRWHLARALAQLDDEGGVVKWFGTNTLIEDQKR